MSTSGDTRVPFRNVLKVALSLALCALFLILAFRDADFAEILASFREARYSWLFLMFGVLMISHVARALRWRYLLDPLKSGIGLRNLFSAVMIGYMMNNVLPRAGELVRPFVIGKLERVRTGAALGTIVVERIMDVLSFLLLLALFPLVYEGTLADSFPWLEQGGLWLAAGTLALFGALAAMMLRRDWTDALLRAAGRVLPRRLATAIDRLAHSFLDGLLFLKRPGSFLAILLLSMTVWGLYFLMTYAGFHAFGLERDLGPGAALVVLTISSIGVAIPTPGGTGTYHFFASETLIRLYAIGTGPALSFAVATHAVGYVGVTLVGLFYFLRDNIRLSEAVSAGESQ